MYDLPLTGKETDPLPQLAVSQSRTNTQYSIWKVLRRMSTGTILIWATDQEDEGPDWVLSSLGKLICKAGVTRLG